MLYLHEDRHSVNVMLARMQRIMAGVEIFALVFWVGGMFFQIAFVKPVLEKNLADNPQTVWLAMSTLIKQFGAVEMIFALIVLLSNFLKLVVFRGLSAVQRVALLISAIMVIFSVTGAFVIQPRLDEMKAGLPQATPLSSTSSTIAEEQQEFEDLRSQQDVLHLANWALGLFLVYAYRSFEERKLQALTRILKVGP